MKARKDRGAKIACVDIYDTGTMKQADVKLLIRPAPMAPWPAPSCTCCSAMATPTGHT